MSEVTATVESEHVPEPKWPELPDRVFVWQVPNETGSRAVCIESDQHLKDCVDDAERRCERYFILRVSPPVERRVSIDWSEIERVRYTKTLAMGPHECFGGGQPIPEKLRRLIELNARIVEAKKR